MVSVILDGENCWEYYKDDGLPFLRALYKLLSEDSTIRTVRANDYLDSVTNIKSLSKLWSGSWINANFAIWIGQAEDNKAWNLLSRTRQFLISTLDMRPELKEHPEARLAWEEIYIAEGSDWCWWYGDDHSSTNDETFDYLFRKHLINVYALLGEYVPEDLHFPIKSKRGKSPIKPPGDFITPVLDGRVTNYFEWQSAGLYETEAGATGTMHKSENLIKSIYYGFDFKNLYFRLDPTRPLTMDFVSAVKIKIIFHKPRTHEILATFAPEGQILLSLDKQLLPENAPSLLPGAYNKVIEFGIPIHHLNNPNNEAFEVVVVILKEGLEQERWPTDSTIQIPYPNANVFAENWHI